MNDWVDTLYNLLDKKKNRIIGFPDKKTFASWMTDPDKREAFYKGVTVIPGFKDFMGNTYKDFESKFPYIPVKKKEPSLQKALFDGSSNLRSSFAPKVIEPGEYPEAKKPPTLKQSFSHLMQPLSQLPVTASGMGAPPLLASSPETSQEPYKTDVIKYAINKNLSGKIYNVIAGKEPFKVDKKDLDQYDLLAASMLGLVLDMPYFIPGDLIGQAVVKYGGRAIAAGADGIINSLSKGGTESGLLEKFAKSALEESGRRVVGSGASLATYGTVKQGLEDMAGEHEGYKILDKEGNVVKDIKAGQRVKFNDINFPEIRKTGMVNFVLGGSLGLIGIGQDFTGKLLDSYKTVLSRVGKAAVKPGAFALETAAFTLGDPVLRGKDLSNVTWKDWANNAAMLASMRIAGATVEKLKGINKDVAKDFVFDKDFNEPGKGKFALNLNEDELKSLGVKSPDEAIDKFKNADNLKKVLEDDKIALDTKQKLLWSTSGLEYTKYFLPQKTLLKDKRISLYDKEGNLIGEKTYATNAEARDNYFKVNSAIRDYQLREKFNNLSEDNKLVFINKVMPAVKKAGLDIQTVNGAITRPPFERTDKENDFFNIISKELETFKPQEANPPPEEIAKATSTTPTEVPKELNPPAKEAPKTAEEVKLKKADIEKRRQEELNNAAGQITIKKEQYTIKTDNIEGNLTCKVNHRADGTYEYRIFDSDGTQIDEGLNQTKPIQELLTLKGYKIISSENLKNTSRKVDKINAKYDAELKALGQSPAEAPKGVSNEAKPESGVTTPVKEVKPPTAPKTEEVKAPTSKEDEQAIAAYKKAEAQRASILETKPATDNWIKPKDASEAYLLDRKDKIDNLKKLNKFIFEKTKTKPYPSPVLDNIADNRIDEVEKWLGKHADELGYKEPALTEEKINSISKTTGIKPKSIRDVYKAGREVFGLNKVQSLAQAIVVDRIAGKIAFRREISKEDVYKNLEFRKSKLEDLTPEAKNLYQSVWHGSPYEFEKFRLEHIGTGEGVEAFGWGLYFTDKENIARGYAKDEYDTRVKIKIKGIPIEEIPESSRWNIYYHWDGTTKENLKNYIENEIKSVKREISINEKQIKKTINDPDFRDYVNLLETELLNLKPELEGAKYILDNIKDVTVDRARNLYKVKIHGDKNVDELNYLRWDKTIPRSQVRLISQMLKKENIDNQLSDVLMMDNYKISGEKLYGELSKRLGSKKAASEFLLRAGIDGIKYPTEITTKGSHENSFNYVIFDDKIAQIEEHIKFQKEQGTKGAIQILEDGKAIIHAISDPNVSTPVHEIAHYYERYMTPDEKNTVLKWAGQKQWDVTTSEKFARGFEKYLSEGKSPIKKLQPVFDRFKKWLIDIYNGIKGSQIDLKLNDAMRKVYSSMLGEDVVSKKEAIPKEHPDAQMDFEKKYKVPFKKVLSDFNNNVISKSRNALVEALRKNKIDITGESEDDFSKAFAESKLPTKLLPKSNKLNRFDGDETNVQPIETKVKHGILKSLKDKIKASTAFLDKKHLNKALGGVFLDAKDKNVVASNAHVMIIIPDKSIKETKIINPETGKKIEEIYPNYQAVIPKDNPIKLKVNVNDLSGSVNGIVRANKFFDGGYIMARIEANGKSYYFKPIFLQKAINFLRNTGDDKVTLEMSEPDRSVVFKGDNADILVMPVLREDHSYPYKTILSEPEVPAQEIPQAPGTLYQRMDKELRKEHGLWERFHKSYFGKELEDELTYEQKTYEVRGKDVRRNEAKKYLNEHQKSSCDDIYNDLMNNTTGLEEDAKTYVAVTLFKKLINMNLDPRSQIEMDKINDMKTELLGTWNERTGKAAQQLESQKDWNEVLNADPATFSEWFDVLDRKYSIGEVWKHDKKVKEFRGELGDYLNDNKDVNAYINMVLRENAEKTGNFIFGKADAEAIKKSFKGLILDKENVIKSYGLGKNLYNSMINKIKEGILTGMRVADAIDYGREYAGGILKGRFLSGVMDSMLWDKERFQKDMDIHIARLKNDIPNVGKSIMSKEEAKLIRDLTDKYVEKFNFLRLPEANKMAKETVRMLRRGKIPSEDDIKYILAKAMGVSKITPKLEEVLYKSGRIISDMRQHVRELDKLGQEGKEKEYIQKAKELKLLRRRALRARATIDKEFIPLGDFVDTYLTNMKLNLMTPRSYVINIVGNAIVAPKRLAEDIATWPFEILAKRLGLIKNREIYPITFWTHWGGGLPKGLMNGIEQLWWGQYSEDVAKREILRPLRPILSIQRLSQSLKNGNVTLPGMLRDLFESLPSAVTAEVSARILNLGDKPFRQGTIEGEIGQLIKEKQLKGFEARKFKNAMYNALADNAYESDDFPDIQDIATKVRDEAKKSVWQSTQDINKIIGGLKGKVSPEVWAQLESGQKFLHQLLKLGFGVTAPFIATPWGISMESIELHPIVPLMEFGFNIRDHNWNKAARSAGKFIVASALTYASVWLINNNIITGGLSKDKKERAAQYAAGLKGYDFNVSLFNRIIHGTAGDKEWRKTDVIRSYSNLSVLAIPTMALADVAGDDKYSILDFINLPKTFLRTLGAAFNQTFLKGINIAINAFVAGDYGQYAKNTAREMGTPFMPNQIQDISRKTDKYIRETKDASVRDKDGKIKGEVRKTIVNNFKAGSFLYKNLPTKVDIFGNRVLRVPEGTNKWRAILGVTNKREFQKNMAYELLLLNKRLRESGSEDASSVLISPLSDKTLVGVDKRAMKTKEFEQLQIRAGKLRYGLLKDYYDDKNGWRVDDDETKAKKLSKLYAKGKAEAVRQYFWFPEIDDKRKIVEYGILPHPYTKKEYRGHVIDKGMRRYINNKAIHRFADYIDGKDWDFDNPKVLEKKHNEMNYKWNEYVNRSIMNIKNNNWTIPKK